MFRIGEFSKLMQVSVRMLRYYDEAGLLKPAQVDKWTGHRTYSVDQIPILNKIFYLRDSGFNVSEIADALNKDEQDLAVQLDKKHLEVEQAIRIEQEKLEKIDNILQTEQPYHGAPETMGIFATRSPMRPNPIALTASEVIGIDYRKGIIRLTFLDADDGTPVLDIKPYTPSFDRVETPDVPDWCRRWPRSTEESGEFNWDSVFNV